MSRGSPFVLTGQRLGPYLVLHEMGHGGMAVVYAAVRADDEYRKRVAIKVVLPGLDSEEILRRFKSERQTLATLDHPNIVKLLDGGSTEQGLPYLVMEYIEGLPIDQYCDSRRLSTTERLRLFRTVCAAVQHAHQNLVVHRDLKPSNILVTADGTPKLLDFGIAKLLNPESAGQAAPLTLPEMRPMTPAYASPEQFRGQPVTTATDVYSLGVVLYELLTGRLPYELERLSPLEIGLIISEAELEKPSDAVTRVEPIGAKDGKTPGAVAPRPMSQAREAHSEKLRRRLRGDLDTIVLMALRKEPQRRYSSVEQLSEDIGRHLDGLPVIARTPTLRYRSAKFIRRHKVGVGAAAAVAAALALGIMVTSHEAGVARAAEARAERRFQDVRRLVDALLFELDGAVRDLPGATPARKLIVQRALQYLDALTRDASGDPALQADLIEAYLKLGEIQFSAYRASLGDAPGALESYHKAIGVAESLARLQPNGPTARRYLARGEQDIAGLLLVTGHAAQAAESLRRVIPAFQAISAAQPADTEAAVRLADSYNALGDALGSKSIASNLRDLNGALENSQKSLAIYTQLSRAVPNSPHMQSGLAVAHAKIGDVQAARGDAAAALESFTKALTIYEALSTAEPNNAQYLGNLAGVLDRTSRVRAATGDSAGALRDLRRSVDMKAALARADPNDENVREKLWLGYVLLAERLRGTDRHGSMDNYRKGLALIDTLAAAQPENLQVQEKLAETLAEFGDQLEQSGNHEEARRLIARGVEVEKGLADSPNTSAQAVDDYVETLLTCNRDYPCDARAAVPYAKRAVELTNGSDPEMLGTLAAAYFQAGDPALAVETEEKAVALVTSPAARLPYEASLTKYRHALKRHP